MTVAAVNGSPKGEVSNSRELISILSSLLPADTVGPIVSQIREDREDLPLPEELFAAEVLFIATPLYVDGLPASLLRFLERYAQGYRERRAGRPEFSAQRVFAAVNCGFYEGHQNLLALEMLAHFCASTGLDWRGGVGVGTGEMIRTLSRVPREASIKRPILSALRSLAGAVAAGEVGRLPENLCVQHALPWWFYKVAGEWGWRAQAKRNGLRQRDLDRRPLLEARSGGDRRGGRTGS